jgi:hypothetical protein
LILKDKDPVEGGMSGYQASQLIAVKGIDLVKGRDEEELSLGQENGLVIDIEAQIGKELRF